MEVQKEQTVQHLNISAIKPDPDQPRKTFNDLSLKLLSDSILQYGVQQPITVRPKGKGYIIVMGERRYRASKLAKLKTIPCMVREFDSNIVSEIQIIENLQREDVEPIEEAEAIAFLLEKYTAEEIAARIGRTVKFIYGRIKLANLIEGFRKHVRNKELTLSLAIGIAVFPKEDQEILLDGMGESFQEYYIKNSIKEKIFDLSAAPFDLTDDQLVLKAGACTVCPFNSANQGNLFGDNAHVCSKASCFNSKKSQALLALIKKVKVDRTLLIAGFRKWSMDRDVNQLVISLLKENGLVPYLLDDIDYVERPVEPTKELIKKANKWTEYSDEELQEELEESMEGYRENLKEFEEAPENGFSQGLILDPSSYRIKEVLLKLEQKSHNDTEERNIPLEKKKMDQCTPKEKIEKILAREDRKQHLEANKEFVEIMEAVGRTDYINTRKALSQDEMVAFTISMYENLIGYYNAKEFKAFYGANKAKSMAKKVENFKKYFKKETFNKLARMLIVGNVHHDERNHNNDAVNNSAYIALKGYYREDIETIEAAYANTKSERQEKLDTRIAGLKSKMKPKTE